MSRRCSKNHYEPRSNHLQLRGRRWSYRRTVPPELRERLGCREVVRALGTESLTEAERLAEALDERLGYVFEMARRNAEVDAEALIARLVDRYVAGMVAEARAGWREHPPLGGEWLALSDAFETESERLARREVEHVRDDARALLEAERLKLDDATLAQLLVELVRGRMDAYRRMADDLDAEERGDRLPPLPQPQAVERVDTQGTEVDSGRTLGELVELYIKDREGAGAWTNPRAAKERKRELQRITGHLGAAMPLAQLDKGKMIELRDQLGEGKSPATVGKLMGNLIALLTFAVDAGWMPSNPARGLRPRARTRVDKLRDAFTDEELAKLFGPQFVRESLERGRPERYWLPLLALYTGARLEELAQLEVWDVREIDGVPCLDITDKPNAPDDETEKASLKTDTSERVVPVHSHLVELGFLDFVEEVRGEGHRRVFHKLNRGSDRGFGSHVSAWFGVYRKRVGVDAKGKVFHSFRHTVPTRLKAARGVEQTEMAELLGHSVPGMTVGRYGKRLDPKALRKVVELLDFRRPLGHLGESAGRCAVARSPNSR